LPEWANRFHQGGELMSELLREEERLQIVRGSKKWRLSVHGKAVHLNGIGHFVRFCPPFTCWPNWDRFVRK